MSSNIFETVTRAATRFQTPKGPMGVEELWHLSLTDLDKTFRNLNKTIKTATEESLLTTTSSADEEAKLQILVIRHIVDVRQKEAKTRELAATRKAQRAKIMEALASAEERELLGTNPEKLRQMLSELDAQEV